MFNCLTKLVILVCLKYVAKALLNRSTGLIMKDKPEGVHHIKSCSDSSSRIWYSLWMNIAFCGGLGPTSIFDPCFLTSSAPSPPSAPALAIPAAAPPLPTSVPAGAGVEAGAGAETVSSSLMIFSSFFLYN
uniref:Putative uncharacterized protein YOR139C n=1 Tax=Saccharomyces cerevisiae (strain ATCC 204508 / S288c) TaxID=559292 RepID=YO139_YEAST|nr:RecName: Full=Putative uncharacterized protein YOR139C; Flags: Precursor [Saccharomyces cerevisiae S288C]CAA99339.1 unnamed protein product [Saccharomyces cerevisiae]